MSAKPSKVKPAKKALAAEIGLNLPAGLNGNLLVILSLVVFAGIPFALGKYFELKCPDPFDSGSYVYSAQHVLSGARIGYEEKPSAQAGTLLVNMLGVKLTGFNEIGSKLLQGLFQAAALTLMFFTIKRLYGMLAAVISVAIASIYLSAPVIAKYGNVKEQFMIALMIAGICCFVWYRLTGRWWWALLTGALLIGGPLFKQTGVAAIAAVGLFVLAGPILYHYAWKKVGKDILLLVAGAMVTLTPICAWYASMGTPLYYWPYSFALGPVFKLAGAHLEYVADTGQTPQEPAAPAQEVKKGDDSFILRLLPGYVSDSWRMLGPAEREESLHRVLRYYSVLILPIALAFGALVSRVVVLLRRRRTPAKSPVEEDSGRFLLLFGLWWFFDMAFVWISPHSYEQYYLPLNASSAVLGGYFVGLYAHRLQTDRDRTRWIVLGLLGVLAMIVLSWHIFFGIAKSPHSGGLYRDRTGQPTRTRGYLQKWQEVRANGQYPWIMVGDYVRQHSQASDSLYVWGWVPGIYVQAQRMSPTPKAFEGMMHTLPPQQLAQRVQEILKAFEKNPPKFIVDTRKIHFPWTRPALELWPNIKNGLRLLGSQPNDREQLWLLLLQTFNVQPGDLTKELFLRPQDDVVRRFDAAYDKALRERIEPAESLRYDVMQPLRSYVMKNYRIVGEFDANVLFQRK
jgi:4-amino-4-deoxy-L-arabinose transferase-like glycosyltransferase